MKKQVFIAAATLTIGFSSGYWFGRLSVEQTPPAETYVNQDISMQSASLTPEIERQATGSIVPSELITNNIPQPKTLSPSAQSLVLDTLSVPPSLQNTLVAAHLLELDNSTATQLLALEAKREQRAFKRMQGMIDLAENPDMTTDEIARLLTPDQFEQYQSQLGKSTAVNVPSIVPQSQAEREGLKAGDKIIRYNGNRVYSAEGLRFAIKNTPPDTVVEVIYVRDGQHFSAYMSNGPMGIGSHSNQHFLVF
ncbi:hypothetical protein PALB_37850 [Pseudoalteromonas luteoviolacea B = ATCC 29581]|nr:hypothetical protein PALB_37850 [Pseudoalteromonas luteoviolacea B = ATCC 29581]